jgi:hypothetical protein
LKPLLLLVLIALFPTQQQVEPESDLLVLKFSWAKEKQISTMILGAQNPGGSITTPIPSDNRDLGSRRVDLRNMEKKAAKTSDKSEEHLYQLHLELKNSSAKFVKSLVWEFKPTAVTVDYQPKQYLCALHVKPNEKKTLEIWTPFVPVKVINIDERKDGLKDGNVVINEIVYTDGSVWKAHGWNFRLPAGAGERLTDGQCSVF